MADPPFTVDERRIPLQVESEPEPGETRADQLPHVWSFLANPAFLFNHFSTVSTETFSFRARKTTSAGSRSPDRVPMSFQVRSATADSCAKSRGTDIDEFRGVV